MQWWEDVSECLCVCWGGYSQHKHTPADQPKPPHMCSCVFVHVRKRQEDRKSERACVCESESESEREREREMRDESKQPIPHLHTSLSRPASDMGLHSLPPCLSCMRLARMAPTALGLLRPPHRTTHPPSVVSGAARSCGAHTLGSHPPSPASLAVAVCDPLLPPPPPLLLRAVAAGLAACARGPAVLPTLAWLMLRVLRAWGLWPGGRRARSKIAASTAVGRDWARGGCGS